MPFKDPEKKRQYQREWIAKRRIEFFTGKCCVQCGCDDINQLELDHKVALDKATRDDHKIWSWSKARREAEIAKCQVLCKTCHALKSLNDIQEWRSVTFSSDISVPEDNVPELSEDGKEFDYPPQPMYDIPF